MCVDRGEGVTRTLFLFSSPWFREVNENVSWTKIRHFLLRTLSFRNVGRIHASPRQEPVAVPVVRVECDTRRTRRVLCDVQP